MVELFRGGEWLDFSSLTGFPAFTLAEVLIALVIIGVVAAMTMPVLIADYKSQKTVTQLKKFYTTFSQALEMAELEYGLPAEWENGNDAEFVITKYLAPQLKVAEIYPASADKTAMCYDASSYIGAVNGYQYVWFDGAYISSPFYNTTSSFKLIDGTCIGPEMAHYSDKRIFVDINGSSKRPNMAGEDLFMFYIDDRGALRPIDGASNPCVRKATLGGGVCAAKIMADGWEIKY